MRELVTRYPYLGTGPGRGIDRLSHLAPIRFACSRTYFRVVRGGSLIAFNTPGKSYRPWPPSLPTQGVASTLVDGTALQLGPAIEGLSNEPHDISVVARSALKELLQGLVGGLVVA